MGFIYGLYDARVSPVVIRYVGKTTVGCEYRLRNHINAAKRGESYPVCRWIRGLLGDEVRPEILILDEGVNETLSQLEKQYIAEFKERSGGALLNATDGGDGVQKERDEEWRRNISKSLQGRVFSEDHKKKISKAHKGKEIDEETRQRLLRYSKGRTVSEETRRKLSEAHMGRELNPEHKRKLSESHKGNAHSLRTCEKISEAMEGRTVSSDHRRSLSQSMKMYWAKVKAGEVNRSNYTPSDEELGKSVEEHFSELMAGVDR